jgi:uncharacterized membrane protein HdeD (DUF308 family)
MAKVEGTGTMSTDPGKWWLVGLLGVLAIAAGVLAIVYPNITLLALGLIVGIYLVIAGASYIGLATVESPTSAGGRVLRYIVGFLSILAGLICLVRPGAGVLALLIALSFWFIITGVADLARALDVREHRVIAIILGVVSIAAGVVVVANPDIGLATLALLAGIGFIVRGTVEVMAAGLMYRLGH